MGSTHDGKPQEIVSNQFYASVELNIGHTFPELPHLSQCVFCMPQNFRQKEAVNVINKPRLMDKWQQVYPVSSPQIQVKPHEHSIVYRLVDDTVETLCGQANGSALDACETPNYLVYEESRNTYRQVSYAYLI